MQMIYFLEDDDSIRKLVIYALESAGYRARGFARPSSFRRALASELPELVLLDLMLPEEDGLSVLKKLRSEPATKHIPVMILTARNTEYDKVIGLDEGADDFITKPFGMMELVARVRALLRRAVPAREPSVLRCGELELCPEKHTVRVGGVQLSLTLKEFSLLCALMENRGMVMTRDALMDLVWGSEFDGENRTVDVHIRTLRSKLGTAGGIIETVRGIGYKIGD